MHFSIGLALVVSDRFRRPILQKWLFTRAKAAEGRPKGRPLRTTHYVPRSPRTANFARRFRQSFRTLHSAIRNGDGDHIAQRDHYQQESVSCHEREILSDATH